MSDPGQEREALEELVELEGSFGPIYPPYTNLRWQEAWDKARAALAAREEPQVPVELQRRFLNDAVFHAEVELARKRLLAEGANVATEATILVVNALLAVREESTQIERSWVVRYPSGTEVRHEYERGARAASSNPETVVREECRRVTSWKGK